MKKTLFLLPLLASFALVGCNAGGDGDDSSGDPSTSGGDVLPISEDQAKTKLYELGTSTGFEISFKTTEDGEDTGAATLGMKGDKVWMIDPEGTNGGYELVDASNLKAYEYDEESSSYTSTDVPMENAESYFKTWINGVTTSFYMASIYSGNDGFHKVKDTTFVGRSATEYSYSIVVLGAQASWKAIIDKDLGITLYWGAQGSSIDGSSGSASFEVTAFKSGSSVVSPF